MISVLILCHMNHCEQHAYGMYFATNIFGYQNSYSNICFTFAQHFMCTMNTHILKRDDTHTHTPSDPFNWLDVLVECNWNTRKCHDNQPNNCFKSFSQRLHKHVRNHVHIFTLNTLYYMNRTWIFWIFIWIIESAWCLNNCNAWSIFCFDEILDEIFILHFILWKCALCLCLCLW